MQRTCDRCHRPYDDAVDLTACPHLVAESPVSLVPASPFDCVNELLGDSLEEAMYWANRPGES